MLVGYWLLVFRSFRFVGFHSQGGGGSALVAGQAVAKHAAELMLEVRLKI